MQKLNKIPSAVWSLFVVIAFGIRDIYKFVVSAYTDADAEIFNKQYEELGVEGSVTATTLNITSIVVTLLVSLVVFEIVVFLVHKIMLRRGCIRATRKEFKARIAFFVICASLVSGIFGGICFAIPEEYVAYIYSAIQMAIEVAFLVACFYFSAKEWYFPRRYAKSYLLAWMICFIYLFVVYVGSLLLEIKIGISIGSIVSAVNVLILAGLSIIPYFNLKKCDVNYDETVVVSVDEDALNNTMDKDKSEEKGDDIFKDLGL